MPDVSDRLQACVRSWRVDVDRIEQTETSVLAFGRRAGTPVVLKVIRAAGDEWRCGQALEAFGGHGVVRVYEHIDGAVLLERLNPATPLAATLGAGTDAEATAVLARVVARMSPRLDDTFPTVAAWGSGFDRYLAGADRQIDVPLVRAARAAYTDLCASQSLPRLLHGDLHHGNVVQDAARGWLAIDPKGVVGELEYEVGAMLRNPRERPELFTDAAAIENRVALFARELRLNPERMLGWGFAQAVLSAIWEIEDGYAVGSDNASLHLADAIRPLIGQA